MATLDRPGLVRPKLFPVFAVVCVMLLPAGLGAQTNAETNSPWMQLNLSVPGARSLGLGGAFLGLADDATAAYANPAGVAYLLGREVSVEARSWQFDHVYQGTGSVQGGTVEESEASDSSDGLSFVSLTYGRRGGKGDEEEGDGEDSSARTWSWGVAVYRHQLAKFRAAFDTDGVIVQSVRTDLGVTGQRLFPSRIRHRVDIENVGITGALAWRRVGLSIGAGLAFYDFEIDSVMKRFALGALDDPAPDLADRSCAAEPFCTNVHDVQFQQGTDDDVGLLLGVLYWPNPRWRFGASFRGGGSFQFEARGQSGPAFFRQDSFATSEGAVFRVPDVLGAGVLWMPSRRWKVAFDLYQVDYSVFAEDVVDVFGICGVGEVDCDLERFAVDDGVEAHLGVELLVGVRRPVYVRVGAWRDPSHALEFVGDEPAFQHVFQPGRDLTHVSFGLGTTGYQYQLDAAVDHSERATTASLSTVVRF